MKKRTLAFSVMTASILLESIQVFAAETGVDHELSVSGGIADPSSSTAVFHNPAGLIYNANTRATGQLAIPNSLNNSTAKAGLLHGDGNYGLAGGIATPVNGGGSSAFYGLGVLAPGIKTAFGFAGNTGLSNNGGTTFNAGALVNPGDKVHLGFTAIGLNGGPREWGAGVGVEASSEFTLVTDVAANHQLNRLAAQPGVKVGGKKAALTLSYGLGLNSDGVNSVQLNDGFSAGGSLALGSSVSWQVYYNDQAKYYTGITIDLK